MSDVKLDSIDLKINGYTITWKQAIDRIIFYCSAEQIAKKEILVKLLLEKWAIKNNVTFVDMELFIKLTDQKQQLLKNLPHCPDCPRYKGPSMEEIKETLAFNEIKDPSWRWLLSNHFYRPGLEDEDETEQLYRYGQYVFYFPVFLFNASEKAVSEKAICYWRRSYRYYCCPAFTVCDENFLKTTGRWDRKNPMHCIPQDPQLFSIWRLVVYRFIR